MEIAGRAGHSAGTESVVAVRQCDPELAASRSIPRFTVLPSCPIHLRHLYFLPPPSLPLPFLVSSDPSRRGGTIKPQDAFREDPVTRALALSSALTKSATERKETRLLRESLFVVVVWRRSNPRIDTLISCHPVSVLVPRRSLEYFSSSAARSSSPVFTPISRERDPRSSLTALPLPRLFLDSAATSSILFLFFSLSSPSNRYICR